MELTLVSMVAILSVIKLSNGFVELSNIERNQVLVEYYKYRYVMVELLFVL